VVLLTRWAGLAFSRYARRFIPASDALFERCIRQLMNLVQRFHRDTLDLFLNGLAQAVVTGRVFATQLYMRAALLLWSHV
jgi:hypothetical protein